MDRLDLNPPIALLHRFSDQLGVVARGHDEFVAVLNVRILKRYLRLLLVDLDWVSIQVRVLLRQRLLLGERLLEPIDELRQAERVDELVPCQDYLFNVPVRGLVLNNGADDFGLFVGDVHHGLPDHVFGDQRLAPVVEV